MLFGAAALCAISMLRVDWQGEADKAREESLAIQAANAHNDGQAPELVSDLEEALNADSDSDPAQPSIPGKAIEASLLCYTVQIPMYVVCMSFTDPVFASITTCVTICLPHV